MKAFIVYCHPSEDSFTRHVRDSFIKGIEDSGNEYVLSDLYKMNFKTDMSEQEYLRDANYKNTPDVAEDVLAEQAKINSSDAIVFIYPVFWTEAPAKLVGWFDRVWSYGFAYGENRTMKVLDKALFLVTAGNTMERLEEFGLLDSMKKVMINDRIFDRAKKSEFVLFPGMTRELASREQDWDKNLKTAYEKGRNLLAYKEADSMIEQIESPDTKHKIARKILEGLRDWFEVDESREKYISDCADWIFLAAKEKDEYVGFLCLKETGKETVELAVMGVQKDFHRKGLGRKLFESAKKIAIERGYSFMQVKTVQMGVYSDYDITNHFYLSCGFKELEVFKEIWGEENPCQIYIMSLK